MVSALVLSVVFARLKITIVSGQILAGMLVGPYVFGLVKDPVVINEISEIGIVLLLFIIGLELDPLELRRLAGKVIILTIIEVAIAFAFGWFASYILSFNLIQSFIFSMTASITSTAIVGKLLLTRRLLQAPEAGFLMALMICEDIIAVVFLVILSSITSTSISNFPYFVIGNSASVRGFFAAIEGLLGGIGLIVLGIVVATYVAPRIINYLSSYEDEFEEIPFLFALGLGLLFAIIAIYLGYSPGIGAFVIGLPIRGKHSRFLQTRIAPIKDLFLVLFFVSIGSLIEPLPSLTLGLPIIAAFVLVFLGKLVGGFTIGKIFAWQSRGDQGGIYTNMPKPLVFGARLVPRGEFSLLIAQFGFSLGLVDQAFFSLIGMTVLVTAIGASILLRFTEPRIAPSAYPFRGERDAGGD